MKNDQIRELDVILDAAGSRRRPAYDYAGMSAERFVFVWSYMRAVEIFSAQLVAVGGGRIRGGRLWHKFDEIMRLANPPLTQEKISELAEWYFEPALFLVLAECLGEQSHIVNELEERFKGHLISKDLIVSRLTTGVEVNLSRAEKLLKIDGIPSLNPHDFNDLKQTAFLKVLETIAEESKFDLVALPPYPLPLRPDIQQIWETDMAAVWWRECAGVLGKIKAGLELTDELLNQKVNTRTQRETERRGGRRRRAILRKRTADAGEKSNLEQQVANRKAKEDLILIARTRWGDKTGKAVAYTILEHKTQKEAASLVDIPYQPFRRKMSKLRRLGNKPK